MNARVFALASLAWLCAVGGAMSFGGAPALAREGHALSSFDGEPGTRLSGPWGIDVDGAAGLVLVADSNNHEVAQFSLAGVPEDFSSLGSNELTGVGAPLSFAAPTTYATDVPGGGDIYVDDYPHNVVDKFNHAGGYLSQITGEDTPQKEFSGAFQLRVDPATGNLWVIDQGHDTVDEFSPTGAYLNQIVASSLGEPLSSLQDVAVDSEGNVYVAGFNGAAGHFQIDKFSPAGVFEFVVDPSGGSSVAVDTSTLPNYVYALDDNGKLISKYEATSMTGIPLEQFGAEEHELQDIGVDPVTHTVYATDYNDNRVDVFTPGETPEETPRTAAATDVEATAATLHGELNPGGAPGKLEYRFDYNAGASCAGGQSAPIPDGEVAEAKHAPVEARVTGLEPRSRYTYCLLAVNRFGVTEGSEASFETPPAPPAILGENASNLKKSEATLNASIDPDNEETTYAFEYATNEALTGATTVAGTGSLSGFSPAGQQAHVTLTGLTAETTYYYRVVAENEQSRKEGRPVKGKVERFTTAIPPETPSQEEAKPVAANAATLRGLVNPNKEGNPGSYEFVYRQSAGECEGQGEQRTPATPTLGARGEAAHAEVSGLLPGTSYVFCLRAQNEAGEEALGPPTTFTTFAEAPRIEGESVADISSTSATFDAEVNPGGGASMYKVESAPAGGSFAPVAEGNVGEGLIGVPLSVHVDGLHADGAYEFRVVAANAIATVTGEPVSFTTQAPGGFVLPDGRQWEQVSPPDKRGALIYNLKQGHAGAVKAAAVGNAIAYRASQPTEAEPQGYGEEGSVLSTRGPAGWSSQVVTPAHDAPVGADPGGAGSEYRFFSEDLSLAVAQPYMATLLSPEASEQTAYLRTDYFNGNVNEHCEGSDLNLTSCFQPLVTGKAGYANVPPGTAPFGESINDECGHQGGGGASQCGPFFLDATPDLSHVVIESQFQLTATPNEGSRYEWGEGRLQPLFLLPAGEGGKGVEASPMHGGGNGGLGASFDPQDFSNSHMLSDDGSVFFSYDGHLYLHDFAKDDAVRLDVAQGVAEPAEGDAGEKFGEAGDSGFFYASADGSRALFSDSKQLTSAPGGGIYECRLVERSGEPACELRLTDLPPSLTGMFLAPRGELIGGSEDATYLYFLGAGEKLSVAHYENEKWTLKEGPVLAGFRGVFDSRVSPNGVWFAFMSSADLTGYDTAGGQPDVEEVYLYNAETGKLACASCDPTGARPTGGSMVPEPIEAGGGEGVHGAGTIFSYQSRYLSSSGRLFFDSEDALVPQDVNGAVDVYEYEPVGVPAGEHACSPASTDGSDVFEPARSDVVEGQTVESGAGCVALISSGTSPEESLLLDASETGGDVFFITKAKLAVTDIDSAPDVYDAHECTGGSPCIAPPAAQPPACATEASCKAAPTPQPTIYGLPSSATFSGPGNPVPSGSAPQKKVKAKAKPAKCKRGLTRRRGRCVRSASATRRARKPTHHRKSK